MPNQSGFEVSCLLSTLGFIEKYGKPLALLDGLKHKAIDPAIGALTTLIAVPWLYAPVSLVESFQERATGSSAFPNVKRLAVLIYDAVHSESVDERAYLKVAKWATSILMQR